MSMTEHRRRRSRRSHPVFFDLTDTADETFDRIILILLGVLLLFSPLALGAVQRWSELVVYILAGTMSLCLAIKLIVRRDVPFVWSWTYLPIAIFLLLTAFQLVPLPSGLLHAISPHTVNLKTSLLSQLPQQDQHLDRMTLSFYPEGTLQNLRLLLAIAAVYVVTLNVIRQSRQIETLLIIVAAIGSGIAVIALLHYSLDLDKIYGLIGPFNAQRLMAPFINPNHFGQFMNLSIGAALALLLTKLTQSLREIRKSAQPDDVIIQLIPPSIWLLAGAIVIMTIGVFSSVSRGAMLGMMLSGGVASFFALRRGMRAIVWIMLPIVWVILIIVVSFYYNQISQRISTSADLERESIGGRARIIDDVLRTAKQFPLLGTGMGTFEFVYPGFDTSNWSNLATHAENEYAQTLFEAGGIGLALLLIFLVMIAGKYLRCMKSSPSPMASMAIGLGFGLLAIAIQSFTDFGQHVPASAMLTAVSCALMVTLAKVSGRTSGQETSAARSNVALRGVGFVVTAGLLAAVLYDGLSAARAEHHWFDVRPIEDVLIAQNWQGKDEDYVNLLNAAKAAADIRPGDIHYQYQLNYYRWKFLSEQVRDPATGHLILTSEEVQWSRQIADELLASAWRCPTYGPLWSQAGQIEKNVLDDPIGPALIRTGWKLSQNDATANFETALLDVQAGQWDDAMTKFRRAADLDSQYLGDGVDTLVVDLHRPDLAIQLADQDVPAMRRIVDLLGKGSDPKLAEAAQAHLAELILSHADATDADADDLLDAARMTAAAGNFKASINYYHRALHVDPTKGPWHLELAKVLAADGQDEDAMDEARTATRLGIRSAENLILELRRRAASQPTSTQGQ